MDKKTLIQVLATKTNISEKECGQVLGAFLDTVTETLVNGDQVKLVGFGSFSTRISKARIGRNPKTGDPVSIEEKRVPKFKPGKTLKDQVNV